MEQKGLRQRVLDVLQRENADQQQFLKDLTDSERAEDGRPDRWAPKEMLAHLAAWQDRRTQQLAAVLDGKTPPAFEDVEEINTADFEKFHKMPWQDVLAFVNATISTLIEQTRTLPEDALTNPQANGRPLWSSVVGDGYAHPQTHLAGFYVQRGQLQRATQMQEAAAEALSQFDKPFGRGTALYNLACFYALNGQSGKALTLLPEALKLAPDLLEWSKQDSDLESLHNEPAYLALYTH